MAQNFTVPLGLYAASANPTNPTPATGDIYYNTSANELRIYNGSTWVGVSGGGGGSVDANTLTGTTLASNVVNSSLTSFGASPTITTPILTLSATTSNTIGRIAWDNPNSQIEIGNGSSLKVFTADDAAATLTNKTISGASNTVSTTGTLTIGTGLSGGSFDGSANVTITNAGVLSVNGSTGAITGIAPTASPTFTGTITTPLTTAGYVTTTSGGVLGSVATIPNAGLTNSSVTVNGTAISLGSSGTITAANPNALTIGTGLSGTSYNGSSAVTIAINSDVVTLTDTQTLTNKTITQPTLRLLNATSTGFASGNIIYNGNTEEIQYSQGNSARTVVDLSLTQTLSNKTITDSNIRQPSVTATIPGASYTLQSSDAGYLVLINVGSAVTVSIPASTFAVGTTITLLQQGTGQVTVQASNAGITNVFSGGATTAAPKTRARYSTITIVQTSSENWYAMGDLS